MAEKELFGMDDILSILPHRPPFLFVDRVVRLLPDVSIVAERDIRPDEFFFEGHFPGRPIMPGVLVTDALAQTSGLLWGLSKKKSQTTPDANPELFYLAAADVKFVSPAVPGDTLRLIAEFVKNYGALFCFSVEACVGRKQIAKGSLTLAMVGGAP